MKLSLQAVDGVLTCSLVGNLEADSVSHLTESYADMEAAAEKVIGINLADVDFIDSTGIGALVSAHKQLKPKNKLVCFYGAKGQPGDMLSFLKIDKVIPCYVDLAELRAAQIS